jgi:two-component system LytT family response regulator
MVRRIRTVIADDEPLIRNKIRAALQSEPDIEIVAECRDGRECLSAVRTHRPDVLLLDVRMPALDGFQVLGSLSPADMPIVVFVTAYDKYALQAFEAHAFDYLLKPFDGQRLHATMERVRAEMQDTQRSQLARRVLDLLAAVGTRTLPDNRIAIKTEGRVVLLDLGDIDWIQAFLNYVQMYVGAQSFKKRESIGKFYEKLDPDRFVRIHRSIIVNVDKIKELLPCNSGEYIVVLKNGKELSCSRGYRTALQTFIDRRL